MIRPHDTFAALKLGTPFWFVAAARLLPAGSYGQFLSADLAFLFGAEMWLLHIALSGALALSAFALLGGAVFVARLRGFAWWAGAAAALYFAQVALISGSAPDLLALYRFNGALLLTAGLVLLVKVERRHLLSVSR